MAKLTEDQLALFRAENFAVVATVGADGIPQQTIVWVDEEDGRPVFNTRNRRAKGQNLNRDPRLSILVWDRDNPHRYVEVEGVAELEQDPDGRHIHRLSRKYTGRDFHTPVDRVIVRITPRRVYDYVE
ncbi:MAG TPA: PPOX class F420-dependent oxidoreductase [Gaiellaceae bacterium]|nr:PPOX class F420-dependent oxidoreductase [Gaiellaceae bacterium]